MSDWAFVALVAVLMSPVLAMVWGDKRVKQGMRCPKCHIALEVGVGTTPDELEAECGAGHHIDTDEGCPGF